MSIQFEYFYGSQAEQFSFYRIPKVLFTDETLAGISVEAKVLYRYLFSEHLCCYRNRLNRLLNIY